MVHIDTTVNGMPFAKGMAYYGNVQWGVYNEAFKAGMRAEALLADHRVSDFAQIEVERQSGTPDSLVSLVDMPSNVQLPGALTAAAIEFGREGFIDPDYPEGDPRRNWGAFPGLHILSRIAKRYGKVVPARKRGRRVLLSRRAAYGAISARRAMGIE